MSRLEDFKLRLERATQHLAAAEQAKAAAESLSQGARDLGGGIPGFGGSGNQSAARKVRSAHDRAYRAHVEADERLTRCRARVRFYTARIAELERVRFTAPDLKGAVAVRSNHGWHRVVRVNVKTVTVPSLVGGSWTDTIPVGNILEARFA